MNKNNALVDEECLMDSEPEAFAMELMESDSSDSSDSESEYGVDEFALSETYSTDEEDGCDENNDGVEHH